MEELRKLYPFSFIPIEDKYAWGTESFLLADLGYKDSMLGYGWLGGNTISEVMDMYMDRIVGDDIFVHFGRQFPFQVKRLSINKGCTIPLRVHPDAETAADRYDFLGKEKLWYISKAGRDAALHIGFSKDTDAGELTARCGDGSIRDILNTVKVREGDFCTIHPGTVHAACGEMEIIEISESSPLDFCLYGWGMEVTEEEFDPALNIVEALDFIDYGKWKGAGHDLPFSVNRIRLDGSTSISSELADTCLCYFAARGGVSIQTFPDKLPIIQKIREGDLRLVPSDIGEFIISPSGKDADVLEIRMKEIKDTDPYTGEEEKKSADEQ